LAEEFEGVVYLDVDDALLAYAEVLGCSLEAARNQLLRPEALESALKRPQAHAHYVGADIPLQAAVLAHGVAESQAFVDGNKRTAQLLLVTFLALNEYGLASSEDDERDLAAWIIDLSEHVPLECFAEWIGTRTSRMEISEEGGDE
jgi:death-on-curing family protein